MTEKDESGPRSVKATDTKNEAEEARATGSPPRKSFWNSFLKSLFSRRDRPRAEELLEAGFILARQGKLKKALATYEKARAADDSYDLAWLNLGLAQQDIYNLRAKNKSDPMDDDERTERLLDIAASLERAVDINPGLYAAWRSLGYIHRWLSRFERAEQAFAEVLEFAPDESEALKDAHRQIRAVRARAEFERLAMALQRVASDPEADDAALRSALTALDRLDDDEKGFVQEKALSHEKELSQEEELSQEKELSQENRATRENTADPDRAHDEDRALPIPIADDDDAMVLDIDGRWARAVVLRRLKEVGEAAEILQEILGENPQHVGALRDLATMALDAGDVKVALQLSMAAYREEPLDAALVCNVGVCHLGLGDLDEAGEFLNLALDLAPKDPIVVRAHATWSEKARS